MEKEIIAELEEEQELEAVIELEKLRGAQGYNTYELYLRNLSKDEIPMTEKEWLNSLSKTNYYKVYTQRYVDDYNRVTKYIPLKINSYNETCLISVAINGFHLLKDKDYQLLDYGELTNEDSEYKYDLNENLRYISLNEPLYTMNHQQIDIEVYKTIVANSEDYEKLKGEGGGANGLTYENNLLQLTENGTPVGESIQIDSNSIFICGENQTIDDAPEEAKIIIDSNIVNAEPSEIVNSMEGNETNKGPSVDAVKKYINGDILYDNPAGIKTEIPLLKQVSDYKRIKIFYYNGDINNSVEIDLDSGKKDFILTSEYRSGISIIHTIARYNINGNKITPNLEECGYYALNSSGTSMNWDSTNYSSIYKVIGYKEVSE